jgi:hypothetical protein
LDDMYAGERYGVGLRVGGASREEKDEDEDKRAHVDSEPTSTHG